MIKIGAHTQGIEGTWRWFKAKIHKQNTWNRQNEDQNNLDLYIIEYAWHRSVKAAGVDPFFAFLQEIVELYPPNA